MPAIIKRNVDAAMPSAKDSFIWDSKLKGFGLKVPRKGATRRGAPRRGAAMANGRYRMHGGPSTGPRTPEGLARSQRANWKYGRRSAMASAQRKKAAAIRRELLRLAALLGP